MKKVIFQFGLCKISKKMILALAACLLIQPLFGMKKAFCFAGKEPKVISLEPSSAEEFRSPNPEFYLKRLENELAIDVSTFSSQVQIEVERRVAREFQRFHQNEAIVGDHLFDSCLEPRLIGIEWKQSEKGLIFEEIDAAEYCGDEYDPVGLRSDFNRRYETLRGRLSLVDAKFLDYWKMAVHEAINECGKQFEKDYEKARYLHSLALRRAQGGDAYYADLKRSYYNNFPASLGMDPDCAMYSFYEYFGFSKDERKSLSLEKIRKKIEEKEKVAVDSHTKFCIRQFEMPFRNECSRQEYDLFLQGKKAFSNFKKTNMTDSECTAFYTRLAEAREKINSLVKNKLIYSACMQGIDRFDSLIHSGRRVFEERFSKAKEEQKQLQQYADQRAAHAIIVDTACDLREALGLANISARDLRKKAHRASAVLRDAAEFMQAERASACSEFVAKYIEKAHEQKKLAEEWEKHFPASDNPFEEYRNNSYVNSADEITQSERNYMMGIIQYIDDFLLGNEEYWHQK